MVKLNRNTTWCAWVVSIWLRCVRCGNISILYDGPNLLLLSYTWINVLRCLYGGIVISSELNDDVRHDYHSPALPIDVLKMCILCPLIHFHSPMCLLSSLSAQFLWLWAALTLLVGRKYVTDILHFEVYDNSVGGSVCIFVFCPL